MVVAQAAAILETLGVHGIAVQLRDDQTLGALPAAALTDSLRQMIRDNKSAIVDHLRSQQIHARLEKRAQGAQEALPVADLPSRRGEFAVRGKFEAAEPVGQEGEGSVLEDSLAVCTENDGSPLTRTCGTDIATGLLPLPSVTPTGAEVHYVDQCPDYCPACGNLDYYRAAGAWLCGWCDPQPIRDVDYGFPAAPGHRAYGAHEPHVRNMSFFREWEIRAAWPAGWIPPRPCGPTLSIARSLRRQEESDR